MTTFSRLASIAHDPVDTTNDLTLTFTHNPAGQIVSRTASDTSYAFTGHASGSVTDTHNGLNQILTSGGVAFQHNQRGSIKAIPGSGPGQAGSTDYVYTEENRLSSVEGRRCRTRICTRAGSCRPSSPWPHPTGS